MSEERESGYGGSGIIWGGRRHAVPDTSAAAAKRRALIAAGMCRENCGRPIAAGSWSECEECREARRIRTQRAKARNVARGLCQMGCGNPIAPTSKSLCAGHLQAYGMRARAKRTSTAPRAFGEPPWTGSCEACSLPLERVDAEMAHRFPFRFGGDMAMDNLGWTHDGACNKALEFVGVPERYAAQMKELGR